MALYSPCAVGDLADYLEHAGDAQDRQAITARLSELRRRGAPRLH